SSYSYTAGEMQIPVVGAGIGVAVAERRGAPGWGRRGGAAPPPRPPPGAPPNRGADYPPGDGAAPGGRGAPPCPPTRPPGAAGRRGAGGAGGAGDGASSRRSSQVFRRSVRQVPSTSFQNLPPQAAHQWVLADRASVWKSRIRGIRVRL